MRPRVSGASRTGSVTSMRSAERRAFERRLGKGFSRAGRSRPGSASRRPLISGTALLALLRGHRPEGLQEVGDGALLAERGDAHGLERRLVAGGGDLREQVAFELGRDRSSVPCQECERLSEARRGDRQAVPTRENAIVGGSLPPSMRVVSEDGDRSARAAVGQPRQSRNVLRRPAADPAARPWPAPRKRRKPPARGWPSRTEPCDRPRSRPCRDRR